MIGPTWNSVLGCAGKFDNDLIVDWKCGLSSAFRTCAAWTRASNLTAVCVRLIFGVLPKEGTIELDGFVVGKLDPAVTVKHSSFTPLLDPSLGEVNELDALRTPSPASSYNEPIIENLCPNIGITISAKLRSNSTSFVCGSEW